MAVSMEGPRITRVLPRVEDGKDAFRSSSSARSSMALGNFGLVTLFDDRVDTPDGAFPLDASFNACMRPDPRAPLTVNAPLGLGLLRASGHWMTYMPRHADDAVRMLDAIEQACAARGLSLERQDAPQAPAAKVEDHGGWPLEPGWRVLDVREPPVWRPAVADVSPTLVEHDMEPHSVEAVLLAVVHLSLLFAPLLIPALVWVALRANAPRVSAESRHALRFQAVFYACAAPVLGASAALGASHHHAVLALLGLILFLALLVAGAGVAFWAAVRALDGQTFSYNPLPNPYATSM